MPIKYILTDDGQYSCPNCGVTKRLQSTMHYHIRNCTGDNNNICTICSSKFYSKNGLEVHMKMRHADAAAPQVTAPVTASKIQTFKCPYDDCTFRVSTKGNCRVHMMRIHFSGLTSKYAERHEHGDYQCTLCKKDFTNSTHYYYHIYDCLEKNAEDDIMGLGDKDFLAYMRFSSLVEPVN